METNLLNCNNPRYQEHRVDFPAPMHCYCSKCRLNGARHHPFPRSHPSTPSSIRPPTTARDTAHSCCDHVTFNIQSSDEPIEKKTVSVCVLSWLAEL